MKTKVLSLVHGEYICHTIRVLEISKALKQNKNYEIIFSGTGKYIEELVKPAGFKCINTPTISTLKITHTLKNKFIPEIFDENDAEKYYKIESELLKQQKPDIILRDHFREFAGIAAKKQGIYDVFIQLASCSPYLNIDFRPSNFPNLLNTLIPEALTKPIRPYIVKKIRKKANKHILNHVKKQGIKINKNLPEGYEADLTLFGDEPELFPLQGTNGTHKFIGPPLFFDNFKTPEWIDSFKKDKRKKILITSGTTGVHEKSDLIKNLVSNNKKYAIAVYANNSDLSKEFYGGNNFNISAVLPFADIAITHGGLGAEYISLKSGTPILALPHQIEQEINSVQLEKLGLGISIPFKKSSPEKIKNGLETLLQNTSFKQNAQKFAEKMNQKDPRELAIKYISEGYKNFKNSSIQSN